MEHRHPVAAMGPIPLEKWRAKGKVYRHKGHRIFYVDEGHGPALLCLHGFPTASWDWSCIWAALAQRFRAIAPDLIGFGFSDKPRRYDYSLFDQADLVEGLCQELGVEAVHVLAHDYGDTVAQELLARRLESAKRVPVLRSVCLLNGGIFPEAIRPLRMQTLLKGPLGLVLGRLLSEGRFGNSFSRIFAPATQPSPEMLSAWWSLIVCNHGRSVTHRIIRYMIERRHQRARWVGALQRTYVPLRLIVGVLDPVSGRGMAERFNQLLPSGDVVVLEEVGHYPQVEAPQRTLEAFLSFSCNG